MVAKIATKPEFVVAKKKFFSHLCKTQESQSFVWFDCPGESSPEKDIDRRSDNLSGSRHQSHVNCVSSLYGIYVSGQKSDDVIGCFKLNCWLSHDVIGCWFVKSFVKLRNF